MNIAQVTVQVIVQVRVHARVYVRALVLVSLLLCLSAASAMAESPAPKKPNGYLPVEDVPKREDPAMSPDDRAKLEKDLAAARDRQTPHKPKDGTKPAKP
jgi:hypothetical protein